MRLKLLLQHGAPATGVMQKALRPALFLSVLLLAAYLRIAGLTWGLSSGYGHDLNFQPDEFVSLRGVLEIDLLSGQIKAPEAYFEGTFNYYLWALPEAVLKLGANPNTDLSDSPNTKGHADLLYICRWMSVLADLCTIVIVFAAIREATRKFYPSLVGALCYAVIPMEVIYAHFMRPHILSNLLCALVIWLSLRLREAQPSWLLVLTGVISGLGAATRYPVGIVAAIPCLYLLLNGANGSPNSRMQAWGRTKRFLSRSLWLIGLGFAIGLFLGNPMLLLAPSAVAKAVTDETLRYASLQQFGAPQLFNLSVVWRYITYLIPFAMYPLLWLIPYCVILYLLFRPSLYTLSGPILIFSFVYLYLMGKGYLGPYFARITMLLFPGFCVLIGIAFADLQLRLRNRRTTAVVLTGALLVTVALSAVFDIAYGRAMQQTDVRQLVRQDLQERVGKAPATIGVSPFGPYFYTVMPAAKPLSSDKVMVRLQSPAQDADFFLIGLSSEIEPAETNAVIAQVELAGKFSYDKSYNVPVMIFGHQFRLLRFPQDMTYPFPTILLFRARAQG
jgi:Dolichyl-phosphate-mannose-protein mannosyltransferase